VKVSLVTPPLCREIFLLSRNSLANVRFCPCLFKLNATGRVPGRVPSRHEEVTALLSFSGFPDDKRFHPSFFVWVPFRLPFVPPPVRRILLGPRTTTAAPLLPRFPPSSMSLLPGSWRR